MNIRLSRISDLPALMEIFREAQATIAQLGIDQWQDGYPEPEVIASDIGVPQRSLVCLNHPRKEDTAL